MTGRGKGGGKLGEPLKKAMPGASRPEYSPYVLERPLSGHGNAMMVDPDEVPLATRCTLYDARVAFVKAETLAAEVVWRSMLLRERKKLLEEGFPADVVDQALPQNF